MAEQDGADLPGHWVVAVRQAGATVPDAALHDAGAGLAARWTEPHRRYHDLAHLRDVLTVVDAHAALAAHPDRVRLAAWLHDAVYDPRATPGANEHASATLTHDLLTALGVPPDTVADVRRLVLLTAGHDPEPGDADGGLLCDADLAVLARDPAGYAAYAAAVRAEYAHVPDPAFRAGRAAVLRALLALPAPYRRVPDAVAWRDRARANLSAELASLGGGDGAARPR